MNVDTRSREPREIKSIRTRRAVSRGVRTLRSRPEALAGLCLTLAIVAFGFIAPIFWPYGPLNTNLLSNLQTPSLEHPFGTDEVGRDVFARTMSAAQLDVEIALVVTIAGALIGIGVGVFATFYGAIADEVTMLLMDALLAFPPLVLALGVSVALGSGTFAASIGITVATVPYYARLMRGEVLRVRALPFVEAGQVSGCRRLKLVGRHILPHTWRIMAVQASSTIGYSVLTLAALGFVGLGVQAPTAEWGSMISSGLSYILTGQWWIGTFPGLLLLVLVTGCNLIADGFGADRRRHWARARSASVRTR